MNGSAPGLIAEIRDGVAWITFNRPQKANALTIEMLQGLEKLLGDYAADDSVRAVVLTATGTRTFSAGADLAPAAENPEAHRAQRRAQFSAALFALLDFSKPAIAAVNGAACGAGMMLAVLCDAVIAAKAARFSLPEINQGMPTLPGITIVSQRFDDALAADLVFSGRFMESDEALRRGVVNQVVASDELPASAQTLALTLGRKDARAYAHNKQWLNRTLRDRLAAAVKASAELHNEIP